MHLRISRLLTPAVALAVGVSISAAVPPTAAAATVRASTVRASTVRASTVRDSSVLPTVDPTPQSETAFSRGFSLPPSVTIVASPTEDVAALVEVESILRGRRVAFTIEPADASRAADAATQASTTIYLTDSPVQAASSAGLAELGVAGPAGMPAEGYVLAVGAGIDGGNRIALSGVDPTGTFYAAQTLSQIVAASAGSTGANLPGILVRDWPTFGFRGGMESFYGQQWSQGDRLSQLAFLAGHKMDTYFYGPSGDARTGSTWSSLYGDAELARLQQVVRVATQADHVNVIYRISPDAPLAPENGMCHASAHDRAALVARLNQLWSIGVRQYTIAWDDVTGRFTCAADNVAYGSDLSPAAAAQASVVNYVQQNFIDTHPGAQPLLIVPTEYWGDASSIYRTRISQLLPPEAEIYWTGPQVKSATISASDAAAAQAAYPGRQLAVWDNYPVNDYISNHLLLGPITGRDAALGQETIGITFNEMLTQEPSHIALATQANYAWNPAAYDAATAWDRALREIGGSDYAALRTFAENNHASVLDASQSPALSILLANFRDAYAHHQGVAAAAAHLQAQLATLQTSSNVLQAGLPDPFFRMEAKPWLDSQRLDGQAGRLAVTALQARSRGSLTAARKDKAGLVAVMRSISATPDVLSVPDLDSFLRFTISTIT